jgi:alpha 1,2-mannosyltransferase
VAPVVARLNLSAILAGVGEYPQGSSKGRGIVVVGGGAKYTAPAFGCVAFVRRTGCTLPIEVWVPPHEPIPPAVAAYFTAFGNVTLHSLGDAFPLIAHDNMLEQKYLAKQLAMLASGFQEVLFLDADNLPLRDPSFLFEEPLYTDTGLLMWPDFWGCETKAGVWEALNIPAHMRPKGSHESGQVVLDKQRAWQPLLLAIYLNMRGDVFYPLLSDIGQGDKETLPLAWLGLRRGEYGLVPHGVGAVHADDGQDRGTAMLQRSPDGMPLFLHVHLPKIDVPRKHIKRPPAVPRRWKAFTGADAVLPAGLNASGSDLHSYEVLNAIAGVDVEVEVLQLRNYLRCQPEWAACCMQLH